jgi:hypothetical protein
MRKKFALSLECDEGSKGYQSLFKKIMPMGICILSVVYKYLPAQIGAWSDTMATHYINTATDQGLTHQ